MQPLMIPAVPPVIAYGGLFVFAVGLLYVFWQQNNIPAWKKRMAFGVVFASMLAVRLYASDGQPILQPICYACQGVEPDSWLWRLIGCFTCP